MSNKPLPGVSLELVEYLEGIYPDRLPSPDESITDRQLWGRAGAAKVIRKLRKMHEEQTKKALEGK